MYILMIGAPGSGKGTQSKLLSQKYNIPHISTGEILRSYNILSDEFQKEKEKSNSGKLISDEIIIRLVKNRIKEKDCNKGFIIDGFPRNIYQNKEFEKIGIKFNCIIELNISDQTAIDRILIRRKNKLFKEKIYKQSNLISYLKSDFTENKNFLVRQDDKKSILLIRLKEFHKKTKPLIYFYRKKAEKKLLNYFCINGNLSITDINKEIIKIFNKIFNL